MLWTPSATQWGSETSYVYKQGIDLSSIMPYALSNSINMNGSSMPMATQASTTFASAYVNIFSNYTIALVDNSTKCVPPFQYMFNNLYYIWILWCPINPSSPSQIIINYPLYPDSFGSNFPFGTVFAYAYANSTGYMIAYRV